MEGFLKWRVAIAGWFISCKILLTQMIWRCPHFRKPPYRFFKEKNWSEQKPLVTSIIINHHPTIDYSPRFSQQTNTHTLSCLIVDSEFLSLSLILDYAIPIFLVISPPYLFLVDTSPLMRATFFFKDKCQLEHIILVTSPT